MPVKKTWLSEIWAGEGATGIFLLPFLFFCIMDTGSDPAKNKTIHSEHHQHLSSRQCQPPASPSSTTEIGLPAPLSIPVVASSLSLSDMSCHLPSVPDNPSQGVSLEPKEVDWEMGRLWLSGKWKCAHLMSKICKSYQTSKVFPVDVSMQKSLEKRSA